MHGVSVHSALAIKRQRRRREAAARRVGKQRRTSRQSAAEEFEAARSRYHGERRESILATKVIGTVTMFHIGIIFSFVGIILLLGPLLLTNQARQETVELIGTGIICLLIGIFLIILNRIYGRRDDDDLKAYVNERLGRSASGGRIYKGEEEEEEEVVVSRGGGSGSSAVGSAGGSAARSGRNCPVEQV